MDKFRQLLKDAGLTQREAAKEWGLSPNAVNCWSTGKRPVPEWAFGYLNLLIRVKKLDHLEKAMKQLQTS